MKRKKLTLLIGALCVFCTGILFDQQFNHSAAMVLLWMGFAE